MSQSSNRLLQGLINNSEVQFLMMPALDGAGGAGVAVTAGAGAWGAYADLIAAKAIATEFWVCGMTAYTAGGIQVFDVQLFNATRARLFGNFKIDVTAVTLNLPGTWLLPWPVMMAANTQIQARAGGAAAKALNCHCLYALGL